MPQFFFNERSVVGLPSFPNPLSLSLQLAQVCEYAHSIAFLASVASVPLFLIHLFPLPKPWKTGFLTVYTVSPSPYPFTIMSRICHITGKGPTKGSIVYRRGVAKKAGGIGTHVTKRTKRKFRPNLQRIRVKLPSGQIKRVWVTVKALKAGLVQKV